VKRLWKLYRRASNRLFTWLTFLATVVGVLLLGVLLWSIWGDGASKLSFHFLNSFPSMFPDKAGIKPALFGSLWVVILTGLFSVPIGVAAAIFLEELTPRKNWLTGFIQLNISNLAGVPSIVYGILGLALFVRWMQLDRSVISGALTMSLLVLPMMITVAQEALRAVPQSFREASFALGATLWQTVRRQVLPNAASGIFTGIILSLSRAMGETAPLILVGAAASIFHVPTKVGDSFTVLPMQIYTWSSMPQKGYHEAAAAAIIVLLVVLLALNSVAIVLRNRAHKRLGA
jgi:phosphate transport system permease protein